MAVPSVSGLEAPIADLVHEALGGLLLAGGRTRRATTSWPAPSWAAAQRLVLAGHLDTVPPGGNETPRVEGDTVWGVGASDMKGGLAVMLELAATVREPAVDVTWCFYAREEVDRDRSGLARAVAAAARTAGRGRRGARASRPSGLVEAGCQGTMRVRITLRGVRAHTARPFTGRNAIHRLAPVLAASGGLGGPGGGAGRVRLRRAAPGGGGGRGSGDQRRPRRGAGHAQPPLRARPRRTPRPRPSCTTCSTRRSSRSAGDAWELLDAGDGAPPSLEHPLLKALVDQSGSPPRAKVGWTDVASFWEHGVPAANFGPGDPLLAHHPDERVSTRELERACDVLQAVIS